MHSFCQTNNADSRIQPSRLKTTQGKYVRKRKKFIFKKGKLWKTL
jgi:hypothetical protein